MNNNLDVILPYSVDSQQGLIEAIPKQQMTLLKKESERSSNEGDGVMRAKFYTIPNF